jgi:hypothetical protein
MDKYTFSFYTKIPRTRLKRRPWWKIFGNDSLEVVETWERLVFSGISKGVADELTQIVGPGYSDKNKAFGLLFGERLITSPQLEIDGPSSSYIPTASLIGGHNG